MDGNDMVVIGKFLGLVVGMGWCVVFLRMVIVCLLMVL